MDLCVRINEVPLYIEIISRALEDMPGRGYTSSWMQLE